MCTSQRNSPQQGEGGGGGEVWGFTLTRALPVARRGK